MNSKINTKTTSENAKKNFEKSRNPVFGYKIVNILKKGRKAGLVILKWSKRPFQRAKILPKIMILEVIYRPFDLKIHLKNWSFTAKNNAQTTSEQLQTNFQKVKKNDFFGPQKWSNHGYQF